MIEKNGKFLNEKCLMEQAWIKNEEITMADNPREESRKFGPEIRITRFVGYKEDKSRKKNKLIKTLISRQDAAPIYGADVKKR
jgi:translation elongation factor EF-Ts